MICICNLQVYCFDECEWIPFPRARNIGPTEAFIVESLIDQTNDGTRREQVDRRRIPKSTQRAWREVMFGRVHPGLYVPPIPSRGLYKSSG